MVYESDFYTTRRPYSRPLASSYSVTGHRTVIPLTSVIQLRSTPHLPYVAHKRIVTVIHTPYHTVYHGGALLPIRVHSRVRPSVLAAELNRIRDLPRPTTASYLEKYLNSKDSIYFDDEAREIRARVDSLLRRVHVFIPRASASDFVEEIVPERMRSGDYVRRLISGRNNEKKDVDFCSWYEVPERGDFNNLACVKYVAGKPHSVRRPYFKVADLRPSDIKNDVNFLSYYSKNRQAAANASPDHPMSEREIRKARALETEYSEKIAKREAEVRQPKVASEPEAVPVAKPKPEPVVEVQPQPEPKPVAEPEPEPEPVAEPEPVPEVQSEKKKEKKEKKSKSKDVRKSTEEQLLKREGRAMASEAAEALFVEEQKRAADENRLKMEQEEEKVWQALKQEQEYRERAEEINEQERQEAERKAEEEKAEAEHQEELRIAEEERQAAAAAEEATQAAIQERIAIEKELDEQSKRQEMEERKLTEEAAAGAVNELKDTDSCRKEDVVPEDITDQEREERPFEIITVDDTHVEEENAIEGEEIVTVDQEPYIQEHEAADNAPVDSTTVEDSPQVEEVVAEETAVTEETATVEEAVAVEEEAEKQQETEAVEEATVEEEIIEKPVHEEFAPADEGGNEAPVEVEGGEEAAFIDAVVDDDDDANVEESAYEEDAPPVREEEEAAIADPEIEEEFSWGDTDA